MKAQSITESPIRPDVSEQQESGLPKVIVIKSAPGIDPMIGNVIEELRNADLNVGIVEDVEGARQLLLSLDPCQETFVICPYGYLPGSRYMRPFAPMSHGGIRNIEGFSYGLCVDTRKAAKRSGFATNIAKQVACWIRKGLRPVPGAPGKPLEYPWGPAPEPPRKNPFPRGRERGLAHAW